MKKTIFLLIFTSMFQPAFAEEQKLEYSKSIESKTEEERFLPISVPKREKAPFERSLFYIKLGASDDLNLHGIPGSGLGYRYSMGKTAVDVSMNFAHKTREHERSTYVWTMPKIAYYFYQNPEAKESLYYGPGIAWTSVRREGYPNFNGITPSATLGFEWGRQNRWGSFLEVTASQPLIGTKEVPVKDLLGPVIETSIGVGF